MKNLIEIIRKDLPPKSLHELNSYLKRVDKVAITNEERAYLLGKLLRDSVSRNEIVPNLEEQVREIINQNFNIEFYDQKYTPDFGKLGAMAYIFVIVGPVGIVRGIDMLIKGQYIIGFNTTFLADVIRDGGYLLILGLIFFIGGLIKIRHEYLRKQILKEPYFS